jgi:uncharacterized protein
LNITQETGGDRYFIRAYGEGRIVINDRDYTRSLLVTPHHLDPTWEPQSLAELQTPHLEAVAALHPEVVLLGTGNRLKFPHRETTAFFLQRGIGFEVMDTAAACRTFNVLTAEGRGVAAALLVR